MTTCIKNNGLWLQPIEQVFIKQEQDDPLEAEENNLEQSCIRMTDDKTEITQEGLIKEELQEAIEDENLSVLDLEHTREMNQELQIKEEPQESIEDEDLFLFESKHMDHLQLHTDETPWKSKDCTELNVSVDLESKYQCRICEQQCKNASMLRHHKQMHHGEKLFKCTVCGKSFKRLCDLKSHSFVHSHEKLFSCIICEKKIKRASDLKKHILKHTRALKSSREQTIQSTVCQDELPEAIQHENSSVLYPEPMLFTNEILDKREAEKREEDNRQDALEVYTSTLIRHQEIKDDIECKTEINHEFHIKEEPQKRIENKELFLFDSKHINHHELYTDEPSKIKCKKLNASVDLDTRYQCKICEKQFKYASELKQHKPLHDSEKSFECTVCGKSFKRLSNLNSHSSIHSHEKPFSCTVCEKKFKRVSDLKLHVLVHSSENAFKCTVCEKRFKSPRYLRLHTFIHLDQKPFRCTICEKSFKSHNGLRHHLKNNTKIHSAEKLYDCSICEKKFRNLSALNSHKLVHTTERIFQCPVCEKSFKRICDLKQHTRVHSSEKAFHIP